MASTDFGAKAGGKGKGLGDSGKGMGDGAGMGADNGGNMGGAMAMEQWHWDEQLGNGGAIHGGRPEAPLGHTRPAWAYDDAVDRDGYEAYAAADETRRRRRAPTPRRDYDRVVDDLERTIAG